MMVYKLCPPMRQRPWGRSAVVSLTLGGAGLGFYMLGVPLSILGQKRPNDKAKWVYCSSPNQKNL